MLPDDGETADVDMQVGRAHLARVAQVMMQVAERRDSRRVGFGYRGSRGCRRGGRFGDAWWRGRDGGARRIDEALLVELQGSLGVGLADEPQLDQRVQQRLLRVARRECLGLLNLVGGGQLAEGDELLDECILLIHSGYR